MNRISALRKEKKMSQTELANMLNVSQGTLSFWENEKYDIDNESLIKLSEIFNVSTDYILCNTDIRDIKKSSGEKPEDIAEDEDDDIVLFNREARKMTSEQRKKLLEMAKVMFGEAYNDESHK